MPYPFIAIPHPRPECVLVLKSLQPPGIRHFEAATWLPFVGCAAADPVLRHRSAVFAPASWSRKIPMICSSVNRIGFMSIPLRGDGRYPFLEEMAGLRLHVARAPLIRQPAIKAEICVSHRIERERRFNTPTPFHTEMISKLSVIEEFEHTIGQNSGVVARHKKSRLSFQDQFRSAPIVCCYNWLTQRHAFDNRVGNTLTVETAVGSENSHSEEISDTFYISPPTQKFYARRMFRWDAIAHLRQRFTGATARNVTLYHLPIGWSGLLL
jgi:hypothetical protein